MDGEELAAVEKAGDAVGQAGPEGGGTPVMDTGHAVDVL